MDKGRVQGAWWRLRDARMSDSAAIHEHGKHPDSWWIGISDKAAPERADRVLGEFLQGPSGQFGIARLAVLTTDEDQIVGMICAKPRGPRRVEVLYGTAPAYRCRGLASEMLALVTHELQSSYAWDRCELVIDPTNPASVKVAERCGYRHVGREDSGDLVYISDWSTGSEIHRHTD